MRQIAVAHRPATTGTTSRNHASMSAAANQVLWLSRGYGKDTVNPTNLGALVQEIERFVSGKEDSIVLIDGLEYLLVQNETQKVVKFIQSLADTASVHRSKVLLPFNTKTVAQEAQRALLTRELVEI